MKLFIFCMAAVAALGASAGELSEVKTVYLLPMPNGLDQFLAIRLTTGSIFQVVTDPQKADAIFTDRIGVGLEQKLEELYGDKSKTAEKDKDQAGKNTMAPLSRGRGSVFLVDRKNHTVIWSIYERPKNSSPDELHHVADRIASRLDKDRKGK